MKRKKYDDEKTYEISFRDEEARRSFWVHMHCMIAPDTRCLFGNCADEDYIRYLRKRMAIAYQLMSLYDDTLRSGKAFGTFLNYIQELDGSVLKYLNIEEAK